MTEWKISETPVGYEEAVAGMDERVAAIHEGQAEELVWLLAHPSLYTAGTSAKDADLLQAEFPVFETGRGGQYTYHGPGQRVAYVMVDLKRLARNGHSGGFAQQSLDGRNPEKSSAVGAAHMDPVCASAVNAARQRDDDNRVMLDLRRYVCDLEEWIIKALAEFGVEGKRIEGRIGIWVGPDGDEKKIAAIGVRVRRGVTLHGIAINVNPDLSHFNGIVPCGIADAGVTSLAELGVDTDMAALDEALKKHYPF